MKKKIVCLMLCLTMVGCGASAKEEPKTESVVMEIETSQPVESVEESKESEQEEPKLIVIESKEEKKAEDKSVDGFCDYLKKKGIVNEEPMFMAADMLGAVEGKKFKEAKIEIYKYDTDSDLYKEIESTQKTILKDFNIEVNFKAVQDGFAILVDESVSDPTPVIECLEDYLND